MNIKKVSISILLTVFVVGLIVRLAGLNEHFTHIDDIGVASTILISKKEHSDQNVFSRNFEAAHSVSYNWTYAPAQFWFTSWLLNESQSYKEKLFWGRFPSFIFGILALAAFVYFYSMFRGKDSWPEQILAVTLLAFSWENIIYCQQMESYSIGVFSVLVMLSLLVFLFRKERIQYKDMIVSGAVISLLCYTQYQVLFFLPAFFISLFLVFRQQYGLGKLLLYLSITGAIVVLALRSLYRSYLQYHAGRGLNWNIGPNQEFLFDLKSADSFFGRITYTITFFIQNFFATLKSNLAFIPEDTIVFQCFAFVFTLLLILGIVRFAIAKDNVTKGIGIFIVVTMFCWIALCLLQKITLSPTRHSLVLQPIYIILVVEGTKFLTGRLRLKMKSELIFTSAFVLVVGSLFGFHYKSISDERGDPFNEKEIELLMAEYKVDEIYPYHLTDNFRLMKNIYFGYVNKDGNLFAEKKTEAKTICLVSSRKPFQYNFLQSDKPFMKKYVLQPLDSAHADYKLVYKREIFSDTEIDFNRHTRNGNNVLFLYIFRRIND